MEFHICEECHLEFTSGEQHETGDVDVIEQEVCDIVEGQFISWTQVICPNCANVVAEFGR